MIAFRKPFYTNLLNNLIVIFLQMQVSNAGGFDSLTKVSLLFRHTQYFFYFLRIQPDTRKNKVLMDFNASQCLIRFKIVKREAIQKMKIKWQANERIA